MPPKTQKSKSIEETLWDSANKLRGSVESAEYKHIVLSLIFLKFAGDTFEERRREIIDEGNEDFVDMVEFYTMKNVFYLPENARWSYIMQHAKQPDIALKIDTALFTIEQNNAALKGALPDNYFSRLNLDVSKLAALLDNINQINTIADKEHDLVGRVYEYVLSNFALAEGKGKGEFYTPKSIVNLIAEMIEPFEGKIYDPCCGSGGMFVQSVKFVNEHRGNKRQISVYGQEYTSATYKLAKMNLAIRGISANLGNLAADTFSRDQHKDLKADFIMANPPFNQKDWRASNELTDDPRWNGYDVPPTSNANYAWILNMVSKLSENGVAGFILANGALSGDGTEKAIRKTLVENHLVEAIVILPRNMFYTTDISVTLWILNKNKTARSVQKGDHVRNYRDRRNEVLFMDLRQMGEPFEKKYTQFSKDDIKKITETYHNWQTSDASNENASTPLSMTDLQRIHPSAPSPLERAGERINIPEYCYAATTEEIRAKDYSLVPSKYIEFVNRDENVDYAEKMQNLSQEISALMKEEKESDAALQEVFKMLGYALKL